jgi:hypothetical protein
VEGLERDQLRDAQAARVHQLQHGAVAQAQGRGIVGRLQQRLDLRLRERPRHAQRLASGLQAHRGVVRDAPLAQRPVEVAPQHREAPVGGGSARLGMARGEVAAQVVLLRRIERQRRLLRGEPLCVHREVAAVGGQGVAREAVFQPQGVDEQVDGVLAFGQHGLDKGKSRPGAALVWGKRAAYSSVSFCFCTTCL